MSTSTSRLWLRGASALVVLLLASQALYLIVGNLVLGSKLRAYAERFGAELGYSRAYTLYPGHLVARDVRLDGDTWSLSTQSSRARLDALALLTGRMHIESLQAAGVRVSVHTPPSGATARSLGIVPGAPRQAHLWSNAGLLSIAGPSAKGQGVSAIALDRLDAAVDEVIVGPYRLLGALQVSGRALAIRPRDSRIIEEGGQLRFNSATTVRLLHRAALQATLPEGFDLQGHAKRPADGMAWEVTVPRLTSGQAKLHATKLQLVSPGGLAECGRGAARVEIRIESASDIAAAIAGTGPITGRLALPDFCPRTNQLAFAEGRVEISDVALRSAAPKPRAGTLAVTIAAVRGHFDGSSGLALTGAFNVRGKDAGVLFDALGVHPSIGLALSRVYGHPFTLAGTLQRTPELVRLQDLEFQSNDVVAEGAIYTPGARLYGALLLGLGEFSLGLRFSGEDRGAVIAPEAGWLANQVNELPE